jgi:large subunit ribosomal protein L22
MEARASAKYLRGSAQKARLVIDMIRGKNVNQALAILRYSNKRAALGIEKCVKSAIANANEAAEKANIAVDPDELWLKAAFVDRGPTKHRSRMRPAPQGRAFRERRHFCHVTILVSSDKQDGEGKTGGKSGAAKPAVSKRAKRGGAAAAPRAKRVGPATETGESGGKKAAASKAESKSEKKPDKTAAKPGKAAGRKKAED